MLQPFREFARLQSSGGIVLVLATVVALVWSNTQWASSYSRVWTDTTISAGIGDHELSMPAVVWINDLLMALFFLLVGLEIKREFLAGQLADLRKAALPIAGAIGGMLVPGVIFAALNAGAPTLRGWGVPVATDIAFALGVLTLVGKRAPVGLKVFLASLAIADDIGALVIIAAFYTEAINLGFLLGGAGILLLLVIINWLGFRSPVIWVFLGSVLWLLVHESGVHATIAGVALAFTVPARASVRREHFVELARRGVDSFKAESPEGDRIMTNARMLGALHAIDHACARVTPPLQRLEHALHPWVAFLIIPLFALSNAGVRIEGPIDQALMSRLALGIMLGLAVGKPVGIVLVSWAAVRLGMAQLPVGLTWRHIIGAGCLGGIGFTMSLFIANLAFGHSAALDQAKLGVLVASAISGAIGGLVLATTKESAP